MGIIYDVGVWRRSRPYLQSAVINLPDRQVHVVEVGGDAPNVGVIERKTTGPFLDFHVEERPYGVVKGGFERLAAQAQKGEKK